MEQRIKNIISEHLCVRHEINNTHSLSEDLSADSLDNVELAIAMESEFDIRLHDKEFEQWQTVQDVIDTVTNTINYTD